MFVGDVTKQTMKRTNVRKMKHFKGMRIYRPQQDRLQSKDEI